ncbi:DUF7715 family protein [Amycolatopsis sp. H20-H5]|uniref:DUF7715 family protein n=1 Tax=Amycolatopsis sp. H20-H5 TaxID=3046309 RepID=UPI002DB64320|nr:hypothetical protein [Amycolatopsis sp. H20-H5]MEC3976108.1 hypothetical protein [Amycolatopsis sp. H20-H5]
MKLLVATARTQGRRKNDFHFCVEGELVWIGMVCTADEQDPDGGCGCGRAFGGLDSRRSTTTALVAEVPGFSAGDYVEAIRSSIGHQGWDPSLAEEIAHGQLELIRDWPPGTVVERRLDEFVPRPSREGDRP